MPLARRALLPPMLAGLCAAAAGGGALAQAPLRMLVYPVPGLFDMAEDGRIVGPGGALITKLGRASELRLEAASLPIARAWQTVLAEPNSCVLGMTRTPERETRFQWVNPVSRADFIVYGRADSPPATAELGALRGRPVATWPATWKVPASTIDRLRQAMQQLRHNGDLAEFGLR